MPPCSPDLAVAHVPLELGSADCGLTGGRLGVGGTGHAITTGHSTPLLAMLAAPALTRRLYGRPPPAAAAAAAASTGPPQPVVRRLLILLTECRDDSVVGVGGMGKPGDCGAASAGCWPSGAILWSLGIATRRTPSPDPLLCCRTSGGGLVNGRGRNPAIIPW